MTEHAFEDLVRDSLASAVEGAAPPPLAARTRRRVQLRQGMFVGAAGMVAVLATFGAARATSSIFAAQGVSPAAPGNAVMDERGSGGRYPCSFDGAGASQTGCIATGERDGLRWTLGASVRPNGHLCMALETIGGGASAGAGSSCNEHDPGSIGIEQTGIGDLPLLAYRAVPGGTERLVLEHGADDSFDLEVYPAPEGFPLDVRFYLVWLPDDAIRFVAYDSSGEVLAERPLDGTPPDTEDVEEVEIGDGSFRGAPWVLSAYGAVKDGRDIVCTRTLVGGFLSGSLAPCDASFGRESTVGITPYFSRDQLPGFTAMGGVTSAETGSVTFVAGGREIEATMIDPPQKVEQSLRFFVAFVPSGDDGELTATVVVRDRAGDVVEERDVCVPGGDGLSC